MTQTLPNNLRAEAALLGAILFDNNNFYEVAAKLEVEDFYSPVHQEMFKACAQFIRAGRVADAVTMLENFENTEVLEGQGMSGATFLEYLTDATAFGPEVPDYASMVADMSVRRKLLGMAQEVSSLAQSGNGEDTLNHCEESLQGLRSRMLGNAPVVSAADRPEDIFAESDNAVLIRTGITDLDHSLKGFERGTLSILAGRPGVGKSAVAVCIGANMAAEQSIGFVSADMKAIELKRRLACYINWQNGVWTPQVGDMKSPGVMNAETRDNLMAALETPQARNFLLNERHGQTVAEVNTQIRAWKNHCARWGMPPLGVVFIDHIAKIAPRQRWSNLYEKTSFACNELLDVAKQHPDIAIVALCQLNRETDKVMRRPKMSDLRDSGKIEEDATAVILLHREDHIWEEIANNDALPDEDRAAAQKELMRCQGIIEAGIAKNRNGEKTTVTLRHSIGSNVIRNKNANLRSVS